MISRKIGFLRIILDYVCPSRRRTIESRVNVLLGVVANRLAAKTSESCVGDVDTMSPRDVTDHVMVSARHERPSVQLCSSQPVDAAWSLLATHG